MQKLLLIDGNSLFHRAYHALPPLTDKNGEMANAVFGFSNMLIKAIDEVKPQYIACTFDTRAPTFRHIEFEKYKAHRKAPPEDLYPQLPKVKKVLDAFTIKYFEKEGYEADDLLATLANKCLQSTDLGLQSKKKAVDSSQWTVVILSGDRDVLQLVDGHIKVQMPPSAKASGGKPGSDGLFDEEAVKEKFGLDPHQMVDYKSLIGDVSDNVPGVEGIGPKTASGLLQKYHTLENLYEHVKDCPLRVREKLEAGRDVVLAAKRLVELDRNVDLRFKIFDLRFKPDWQKIREEFERLGFKSIAAKISSFASTSATSFAKATDVKKATGDKKESKTEANQLELI